MSNEWNWVEGNWKNLYEEGILKLIDNVPLTEIISPWSRNAHLLPTYDRLFWDVWENGIKTPLFVRPYDWPPIGSRGVLGCNQTGNRIDAQPAPQYELFGEPEYELIIGNMRFCAAYVMGIQALPCLLLPEEEWYDDVDAIWGRYHPVFEGNYYKHPDYLNLPSKAQVFSKWE